MGYPTRKIAFLAGVDRFCKQAGLDGDDQAELTRLLFMRPTQALPIVVKAECEKREALVKRAGSGLIKLANGPRDYDFDMLSPNGNLADVFGGSFEGGPTQRERKGVARAGEPQKATGEAEASDTAQEVQGSSAAGTEQQEATRAAEQAEGRPVADAAQGVVASDGQPQPGAADKSAPVSTERDATDKVPGEQTNVSAGGAPTTTGTTPADYTEKWDDLAPQVQQLYGSPERMEQMRQDIDNQRQWKNTTRTMLRGYGVNAIGGRGGSMRWQNINPGMAGLSDMQRSVLQSTKDYWQNVERMQQAARGPQSGWAVHGTSMKTGPQGIRALRGRGVGQTAQQAAASASSTAAAAGSPNPQQAAAARMPARTGTATFAMSEGTGGSAKGEMPVVGGAKPWRARGSTGAFGGDTSRMLSVNYPGVSPTPTQPPSSPAQAAAASPTRSDSLNGARPMQQQVNQQMAEQSGMATPNVSPTLPSSEPYKLEVPETMQNATTAAPPAQQPEARRGTAPKLSIPGVNPAAQQKKTMVPGPVS